MKKKNKISLISSGAAVLMHVAQLPRPRAPPRRLLAVELLHEVHVRDAVAVQLVQVHVVHVGLA